MNIFIAGISGFIGLELKAFFENNEYNVIGIPRQLSSNLLHVGDLADFISNADVIINLSGAPMIHRHTETYRKILRESRINTTRNIVKAIELNARKPELLISLSATGIYSPGKHHDELQFEPDDSFAAQLCVEWEAEAFKAEMLGVRTIVIRTGIVLGQSGGIVKKLMPMFRMGAGAVILPASSPFPWVHIKDFCQVCLHFIRNKSCRGVFNLSANSMTNQLDFAKAFAHALKRPLLLVVPAFMLKIMFGKGAEIITRTAIVNSRRLNECHYQFMFTDISEAMNDIVSSNRN